MNVELCLVNWYIALMYLNNIDVIMRWPRNHINNVKQLITYPKYKD